MTLLISFGIFTANANWPFELKDADEAKHGVTDIQPMAYVDSPPYFLFPIELGFGVAVEISYDLFYLSDSYFLCKDNVWYAGKTYLGPWMIIDYWSLPPALRQYKVAKIRTFRDRD